MSAEKESSEPSSTLANRIERRSKPDTRTLPEKEMPPLNQLLGLRQFAARQGWTVFREHTDEVTAKNGERTKRLLSTLPLGSAPLVRKFVARLTSNAIASHMLRMPLPPVSPVRLSARMRIGR